MYHDSIEKMGLQLIRRGEPVERLPKQLPPCGYCPKIPRGAKPIPANAINLSPKNAQAWRHYRECKAVGVFPDDPIVRRNASIISAIEEYLKEKNQQNENSELLRVILNRVVR